MNVLSLLLMVRLAAPVAPAPTPAPAPAPAAAKDAPATVQDKAPMDPAVKKAVDTMQKFYEETKDFQADFRQTYKYKTFAHTSEASGKVLFAKVGPSMRWDYLKPEEKAFVVSGEKVYAYLKEAKQLMVSRISADRLSASITFLWGQGKLEREFRISKAARKDLKDGVALELVPKIADPRFQRIFFLLDPKVFSVKETIVVDPDGSENRMAFANVKTNTGVDKKAFEISHPDDTQIIRQDAP